MTSDRKHSLIELISSEQRPLNSSSERRWRRTSLIANPLMNRIRPFIYGSKNDDAPDCYNRVRYIRDSCKVLSDLWKTDKDFLNKSIDSDVSKLFKEFRGSEVARNYRSPYGPNGSPSILNKTIDDLIQIHDFIDSKRKDSLEQLKKIIEQAKDKQSNIRQTINEDRDNYEKAQRKLETADANLKKYQSRSDRLTLPNFDERLRELDDIRSECEQSRTLARDIYFTEIYKYSGEENSIANQLFYQYLFQQNQFYNEISKYFSLKIPEIEHKITEDEFIPPFRCDLIKHCSKRFDTTIAYPIEICIQLLQNSIKEEGIFRIAPSIQKQKKFVSELDLYSFDKGISLNDIGYDSHVPANTLKQYLRELPDCLLTSTLFTQWNEIQFISNEQERVHKIGQLINQLPKINYDNLCYLVRFLARVCEYSSENKMTASNLGICIGCSILYPRDQSSSNSYTSGSSILELMIIYHKQLFTNSSQPEIKTFKSQPDIIPTEFRAKSRTNSNENLLDAQSLSTHAQPSPGTRRKNKAPPPPPPPPSASASQQTSTSIEQIVIQPILSQLNSNDQISNENLLGNTNKINKQEKASKMTTSKSIEEPSSPSQSNQFKNIFKRFTRGATSSSFSPSDKIHRRTPSDSGIQLDRPQAPPPLPPPVPVPVLPSPTIQMRQKINIPLSNNNEQDTSSLTEDKTNESDTSTDTSINQSSPNDGVNVTKLISELNTRMANAKINNTQTNNIRASSIRNSTLSTPGETTDF